MKNLLNLLFTLLTVSIASVVVSTLGFAPITSVLIAVSSLVVFELASKVIPNGVSFVNVCGKISANILADCDDPLQTGTVDRAIVINLDDIESVAFNTNKMIVEDIVLKVGKTAFVIDGINNSIMPKATMIQQTFAKVYDHIVKMIGFDISPATKENLEFMKYGRFVVIAENVFRGTAGNSAFEVYGLNVGLEITILEKDPNNVDTQGGFDFTFATNKNKEPKMPLTFFDTDYTTTKALIDGLL